MISTTIHVDEAVGYILVVLLTVVTIEDPLD